MTVDFNALGVRRPIILIGAARSGTKILRAAIAAHHRLVAIPYDVNFVWKMGNYAVPHDELRPDDLGFAARAYIHWYFRRWQGLSSRRVVEKTVSNALRVDFVREVFPDCQFIHLYRDGRDVATSARRMWKAPLDWKASLTKIRRFPMAAVPSYGVSYVRSYMARASNPDNRVSSWGPRFAGIDEIAAKTTLLETCAWQWRKSIEAAREGLEHMPQQDVIQVRYEDFVARPLGELERIMGFLGLDVSDEVRRHAEAEVRDGNISKWKSEIAANEIEPLMAILEPTLRSLGYEP